MIESKVQALESFIVDIWSKDRDLLLERLCDIYSLEFTKDHVENLFEFPEVFLGENEKGEVDWSNWAVMSDEDSEMYTLTDMDKNPEESLFIPTPQTIGDFIDDCRRFWDIDLVWDGNLVKRKFNYELQ